MRFQKQIVPFITISTLSLKFPVTESSSAPSSCLHTLPAISAKARHALAPHHCTNPPEPALSLAPHHHACLPCQRRGSVARKNSGDYRRDCHTTIPLAFRRASVCVWLYGFASALSHLAFRRGVSLLLPKHHCNYKKQFKRNPMQKRNLNLILDT